LDVLISTSISCICGRLCSFFFCFQAEDGILDDLVTVVQTCALPILIQKFIVMGAKQYFLRERHQTLDVFIADDNNQLEHLQYQHTSINDFVAKESHLYVFDEQKQ